MLLIENIKLAISAIRSNKMRSCLTMLGIIIGISSVIAITSIGASAKAAVGKEFEAVGMNYMYIYPNWQAAEDGVEYSDLFMPDDIEALHNRFPEYVLYSAPYATANSDTKIGRQTGKLQLYGVNAGYHNFTNMNIIHGRMINQSDVDGERDRIVIDKKAALHFFNREDPIGETIGVVINNEMKDLTIIGVYEVPPSIFSGLDMRDSFLTYVPYPILQTGDPASYYIELYVSNKKDTNTIAMELIRYLARIKDRDPEFYTYQSAESQLTQVNSMLGTVSIAIGAIAAISLVVGGIGIMNIMLVSVTERTREIGIRKSLGARTRDILMQFLIEAMIISAIGGIIGTALGITIAGAGMSFAQIDVVIDPKIIVLAVAFSAMVGMFFGLYPARKAAKLDPIEALRYE